MTGWVALGSSVVLSSSAQIFLKRGVSGAPGKTLLRKCASPWVLAWAGSFAAAMALWVLALSHLAISYAYPLLGSGYVLVLLLAAWLLKERITMRRWMAILLIAAGAVMVARSQ